MTVSVRRVSEVFGFSDGVVGRQYAGALRNSFVVNFGSDLYFVQPVYRRGGAEIWKFKKEEDWCLFHSYEVVRHRDGYLRCDCPGASKMRDGKCRHVKMLLENVLPMVK